MKFLKDKGCCATIDLSLNKGARYICLFFISGNKKDIAKSSFFSDVGIFPW